MKIHVLADVHNEFSIFNAPPTKGDVVILAGDVDVGLRGLLWAHETFRDKRIVYVGGNHEYYHLVIPSHTRRMRQDAAALGIHFLENSSVVIGDVVIFGCTLWTDFALFGNIPAAAMAAEQQMMDYSVIRIAPSYRTLRARDTARLHQESISWLREELPRYNNRKVVVVSHHAPSLRSIAERYKNDVLSASFASPLDEFVAESGIHTWVHGHVHDSTCYEIGRTRVVCNVRGYPREADQGFDPGLTIDV